MKKSQPIRVIAAHRAVFPTATELRGGGMGEQEMVGGEGEIHGMRKTQNMRKARKAGKKCISCITHFIKGCG